TACSRRQILTRTDAGFDGIVGMNSTHRAPSRGACLFFTLRFCAIAAIIRAPPHPAGGSTRCEMCAMAELGAGYPDGSPVRGLRPLSRAASGAGGETAPGNSPAGSARCARLVDDHATRD